MTIPRQSRRSFISVLTSLAGATAIEAASPQAAQAPASAQNWDLRWIDDLKAQHKQVFDMADADPAGEPPPLRLPRNYLDAFRDVYKLEFPEVRTIVGISGRAFPVNASDRLWEKYALGERSKIIDPLTKKPAVRNIFMDDSTLGVKALQARGTIFWQCNIALTAIAQQLAQARQLSGTDVRADLLAGLNAGVRLIPSHVMAMGLVQERGVTYVKISTAGGTRTRADILSEVRGGHMQDLRLAIRALYASPLVTTIAVASLALGIGANAAIFSLVSGLLLRALPVVNPERLAMVSETAAARHPQYSYATLDQIRQHTDIFDGALAYTDCCGTAILNLGDENQSADRQFVSGDFFTTLGVRAFRGRMLTPADDVPAASTGPVAVISYRLWRRILGGREDAVGARLSINRIPVTVVGVMPPSFFGVEVGRVLDLAMPYRLATQFTATPFDDDTQWLNIMVRLKPGLPLSTGGIALRAVQSQIRSGAMPATSPGRAFLQDPLTLEPAGVGTSLLRQRFERPLLVIFAVVALVLLIACANIGNLLLVRGIARRHELSIRVALGASRWRLLRQLLAESVLLSTIGAAVGLALAPSASRFLVALLATSREPIALDLMVDGRVLGFTVATTAITAILFGAAPALRATRVAPIEALNAQGRTVAGDRHPFLSSSLIVAQVVLSLVLVVAAGLFVQTFERLTRVSLGFDREHVVVASVNAPTVTATERSRLFGRLVEAAGRVPGVVAAGGSMNPPIVGELRGDLVVSPPGTSAPPDAEQISQTDNITPGWMAAYGVAIRAGRDLNERDTLSAPRVMLVNEAFARRFSGGRDIVGTTLALAYRSPPSTDFPMGARTIVGVVGDSVARSIREPARPALYLPLSQWDWPLLQYTVYIGVRSATDSPALVARGVGSAMRAINGDLTMAFEPLAQQVDESLAADRVLAMLSGFFGALALLLAGLGLYGVTSYAIVVRRTEIGIRMAIGAAPADVVRMVLSRVSLLVGVGLLAGAGISVWAGRFLASLLFGLEPGDPATLAGSAGVLVAVAALAGGLPAWRASRSDPAEVLRQS